MSDLTFFFLIALPASILLTYLIWLIGSRIYKRISERDYQEYRTRYDTFHNRVKNLPNFTASYTLFNEGDLSIALDQVRKKIFLYRDGGFALEIIKDSKQIIDCSIIVDEKVITDTQTRTKSKNTIGRALVGGAIAGPVGAVIGGMTGKKESTSSSISEKQRHIHLCLHTDPLALEWRIPIVKESEANLWHTLISKLINEPEVDTKLINKPEIDTNSVTQVPDSPSTVEIIRLGELLDRNEITLQEYRQQTSKILESQLDELMREGIITRQEYERRKSEWLYK